MARLSRSPICSQPGKRGRNCGLAMASDRRTAGSQVPLLILAEALRTRGSLQSEVRLVIGVMFSFESITGVLFAHSTKSHAAPLCCERALIPSIHENSEGQIPPGPPGTTAAAHLPTVLEALGSSRYGPTSKVSSVLAI